MKKLMFALLVCGATAVFAEEVAAPVPPSDAEKVEKRIASEAKRFKMSVEEYKKLTPEQVKAKKAEQKAVREAAQAKKLNLTVEEYKKLTPAERREKLKAAAAAERAAKKDAAERAKADKSAKKAPCCCTSVPVAPTK